MERARSSRQFTSGLLSGDLGWLKAVPKADLHCHSLLSTSLSSIQKWTGKVLTAAPSPMKDFDEMRRYLHDEVYPHIRHRNGFEFTATSSVLEAIEDGVAILEMSLDVDFIRFYSPKENDFFDFVQSLSHEHDGMIEFRPEIGISKNRAPAEQIPLAMECIQSGLFRSIDLYGNEDAEPPESYQGLYRHAAARGLKRKAHVGEFGDAALVEKTLRVLDLQEIQHGIAVATSAPLMKLIRIGRIRLNVCPGSNVALSAARDLAHHPIRKLIDNGVRVSINSDDKTVFGRSVSEEYLSLYKAGVATAEELDAVRVDSLQE